MKMELIKLRYSLNINRNTPKQNDVHIVHVTELGVSDLLPDMEYFFLS